MLDAKQAEKIFIDSGALAGTFYTDFGAAQ